MCRHVCFALFMGSYNNRVSNEREKRTEADQVEKNIPKYLDGTVLFFVKNVHHIWHFLFHCTMHSITQTIYIM